MSLMKFLNEEQIEIFLPKNEVSERISRFAKTLSLRSPKRMLYIFSKSQNSENHLILNAHFGTHRKQLVW